MILASAYIGLTLLMNIIICFIGFHAIRRTFSDPALVKRRQVQLIGGLAIWQVYLFGLASTGILTDFSFPPKFFLLMVLPAFMFTGVFIYRNRHHAWIRHIPKSWLIYYQTFRILIESLFVFSVAAGTLHPQVTIEGYNFDMIFAITAPIVAFLVFSRKLLSEKVAVYWNYLGLAVIASIIFLFLSTTYLPELYGSTTPLLPKAFGTYPYVLVAGFLMPSAVFMHVLSIVQLSRQVAETEAIVHGH